MGLDTTAITEVDSFTAQIFPPAVGTPVLAEDVKALAQVAGNRTRNLNIHKADYVVPTGKTQEFQSGATQQFDSGSTLSVLAGASASFGGPTTFAGQTIHDNEQDLHLAPPILYLSGANHTLDASNCAGGVQRVFIGTLGTLGADVTLTLADTTNPLPNGTWLEITFACSTSSHLVTIARETPSTGGAYIAKLGLNPITNWPVGTPVAGIRVVKHAGLWLLEFPGAGPINPGGDAFV